MDKSLDEIIKSKRSYGQNKQNFGGRGRGRGQRGGFQNRGPKRGGFISGRGGAGRGVNVKSNSIGRGGIGRGQNKKGRLNLPSQKVTTKITDARDKLNLKARQTDARVKLIKKAHSMDARQKLQAKRKSLETGTTPSQPPNNINVNTSQTLVPSVTISNPQARKRKSAEGGVFQTKSGSLQVTRKAAPNIAQKLKGKQKMNVEKMVITTSNDSVSSRIPVGSLKSAGLRSQQYEEEFVPSAIKIRKTIQAPTSAQPTRQPATQRLSPLGTRVYVTKLHYSVTEEDIKELFGAVGALRKARFVKQGVAEVVYVDRESALEAISIYNNRELDGVPMQCKLDSSTVPEATSAPRTGGKSSRPISDRFKFTRTQSAGIQSSGTMRADDVEANLIHKALFKTAAPSHEPTKPVVFTVKI